MSNIAVQEDQLPDYMRGHDKGMQNIGSDDVAVPRLQLIQALSPELDEYDDLKAGSIFHSGAGFSLGDRCEVVPLFTTKSYTLWRPRPAGGILARSRDGLNWDRLGKWTDIKLKDKQQPVTWEIKNLDVIKSGLTDWGSSDPDNPDSKPAAVLSYNIPVLIVKYPELGPAVLSLQRSQIKAAKKLLGRLKINPAPIYGLTIPIEVVKEMAEDGPFFNWKFGKFGHVGPDLFKTTSELNKMFMEKGVTVREEDEPDDNDVRSTVIDEDIPF